jgi:hypothetical protein
MATITSFQKWHEQPDLTVDGQTIEVEETWVLVLSTRASTVAARNLIGALTSGNAYGWPLMGIGSHADDSTLKAINYNIARDTDGGFKFLVSLTYNNLPNDAASSSPSSDASTAYDYQEVTVMEEIDIDPIEETAIQASNGEAYWPKIQRPRTLDRILVTRNEDRFKPNDKKRFRNKVNSTPISIDGYVYDTRSILIQSITGKREVDQDGEIYYVVRYVLLYDPDKLHQKILLDVANGPDDNGTYPQAQGGKWNKPWKLDGSGVYATKAQQKDPSFAPTNTFNVYAEVAMNGLRL